MTRKIKRRLNIGDEVYYWVADKKMLDLYPWEKTCIRVHQDNKTKSILYIDVNARDFKIMPETIKRAIEFALCHHWNPQIKGEPFYITMNENSFMILPQGEKHSL